jgi:hypothetical protein
MKKIITLICWTTLFSNKVSAQQSVARQWIDTMLQAIREDLARPNVQARNLHHVTIAMYEAWAVYDPLATQYLLGKTVYNYNCSFGGFTPVSPTGISESCNMAISYAAYRILLKRYSLSPNAATSISRLHNLMKTLNYDTSIKTVNYSTGSAADLGNYIAQEVLAMGLVDGANEANNYQNIDYAPVNGVINTELAGNPNMYNPNRWQPLFNPSSLDQNGNPINSTQKFEGAEWGRVNPFALPPPTNYSRNGKIYPVYYDPGPPPMLDTVNFSDSSSYYFNRGHAMVAVWGGHHTPDDNVMWDISPRSKGNVQSLPTTRAATLNFYNFFDGGDPGLGYTVNPITGMPYTQQFVKRGDYTRVVSQYWADGPTSETPPGHWFKIYNEISDNPSFVRKYEGTGPVLGKLEYDIKAYFTLGGAMHDAAISAWSIKGWYDNPRPFSMIRKMDRYGQSTENTMPRYHAGGLPVIPNYIEQITATDPLVGFGNINLNKMKVKSWIGFGNIGNPSTDYAGVDWLPAENWMPYQRRTFVTPPFAGYVSGHSTYSRSAAEVLTYITGSEFFPGGLYEFNIAANSNFLVFEAGPSTNIKLQYATYRDASNESSLSRIWGGIHPYFDDMPGRIIGVQIGTRAHFQAASYFTGAILPVYFSMMQATEQQCKVKIAWSSVEQSAVRHYRLWKSTDGVLFNTILGTFAPGKHEYSFLDLLPNDHNYYRIEIINADGSSRWERIMHMNMKKCSSNLPFVVSNIYPNPTKSTATFSIANNCSSTKQIDILLFNANGSLLKQQKNIVNVGQNQINIDVATLTSGHYFVRVQTATQQIKTMHLIKD